jgi:hypothetical protein
LTSGLGGAALPLALHLEAIMFLLIRMKWKMGIRSAAHRANATGILGFNFWIKKLFIFPLGFYLWRWHPDLKCFCSADLSASKGNKYNYSHVSPKDVLINDPTADYICDGGPISVNHLVTSHLS